MKLITSYVITACAFGTVYGLLWCQHTLQPSPALEADGPPERPAVVQIAEVIDERDMPVDQEPKPIKPMPPAPPSPPRPDPTPTAANPGQAVAAPTASKPPAKQRDPQPPIPAVDQPSQKTRAISSTFGSRGAGKYALLLTLDGPIDRLSFRDALRRNKVDVVCLRPNDRNEIVEALMPGRGSSFLTSCQDNRQIDDYRRKQRPTKSHCWLLMNSDQPANPLTGLIRNQFDNAQIQPDRSWRTYLVLNSELTSELARQLHDACREQDCTEADLAEVRVTLQLDLVNSKITVDDVIPQSEQPDESQPPEQAQRNALEEEKS